MSLHDRTFQWVALLLLILVGVSSSACRQAPQAEKPAATSPTTLSRNPAETPTPVPINQMPSPEFDKPYPGTGTILIINRKEGWVEIKHGEIKGLMPAMEMEFWVKSRKLLDNLSVGDHVDFTVVETRKGEYITRLKKTSTGP
jgi:Cu/Ag efflux protein CusF